MRSPFALLAMMVLALVVLLAPPVSSTNIRICNQYVEEVHLSWDVNDVSMTRPSHSVLGYDQCYDFEATPGWAGAVYLGYVNNSRALGAWRDSDTKVEFSVDLVGGFAWFDVSHIKGFSLPTMVSGGDKVGGCAVDKLYHCPQEWSFPQNEDEYRPYILQCRNDGSEAARAYFEHDCPDTYVRWNDDAHGTKAAECPTQLDVVVRVDEPQLLEEK